MRVGYARVSTDEQRIDLQIDALNRARCDRIFTDHGVSGRDFDRRGLEEVLSVLTPGDTLVVWRLDRLGRSLIKLVEFMTELSRRNVDFQSLTENIDTASSGGRLVFHMMAALAEFERSLISERTRAGMEVARKRGKHLGRPRSLTAKQVEEARQAVLVNQEPLRVVARRFNISSRSLYRIVKAN